MRGRPGVVHPNLATRPPLGAVRLAGERRPVLVHPPTLSLPAIPPRREAPHLGGGRTLASVVAASGHESGSTRIVEAARVASWAATHPPRRRPASG